MCFKPQALFENHFNLYILYIQRKNEREVKAEGNTIMKMRNVESLEEKRTKAWSGQTQQTGEESRASESLQTTVGRLNVYLVNGCAKTHTQLGACFFYPFQCPIRSTLYSDSVCVAYTYRTYH